MQKTLRVMKAAMIEPVELASYRLQDVAVNWYESWEFSRELRRARVDRFLTLRQGNLSIRECSLQFDSLARYAPTIPDMDISRIQAYAQGVEERKQKQRADREHDRAQNKRARSLGPSGPGQNFRASSSQYRGDSSQMRPPLPRCAQCGKQHAGQCRMGLGVCYTCGYPGHVMRDCPTRGDASITQPAGSVAGLSSSVRPPGQGSQAPMSHHRGRGGASSSSDPQNRIYALVGRQDHKSSPDVVTGSTLSYVTLFVASKFRIKPELVKSFEPEKRGIAHKIHQLASLGVRLLDSGDIGITIQDTATSFLVTEVKEHQYEDPVLVQYRDTTPQKGKTLFEITKDGVLRYRRRLCVTNVAGLRRQVMGETQYFHYSIHPGATKMYHDIKEVYWWDGMKKDIAEFVSRCPNYQQVKIEH
ncbi:uncharacterized protein [Nicotiana tomentosiformis]|uniref:uncharacterized protein n=1 Tax=Nicotiana tomentosiformis TaxID=4098 RepID=UPI00388C5649